MTLAELPADQVLEVLKVFAFALGFLGGLVATGEW